MAEPTLAEFEDLVVEVEFTPGSGTFARVCAIEGITINRSKQIDENETPADCDDESLPYIVRRNTRSRSTSISGTGFWAAQSHGKMMGWYNGTPAEKLQVRIHHAKALSGDTEYEEGAAILQDLNNERTKGAQVSAEITIVFDGAMTLTAKA